MWFKTKGIYSLSVLEARSLKSRCWQSMLPLKAQGKNSSLTLPSFSWLLSIFGVPWLIAALFQSLPLSLHGVAPCVSLYSNFYFLIRTPINELIQFDFILTCLHCQRPYNKVTCTDYQGIGFEHIYLGDTIQPSKWQYFTNWFMDSMQSLPKPQLAFAEV